MKKLGKFLESAIDSGFALFTILMCVGFVLMVVVGIAGNLFIH